MKKLGWVMLSLLWTGMASAAGMGLMIENPWVREAPPAAKALAGYMIVSNHGDKARTLVAASSPTFKSAMLHRTVMEDGMAKMIHQEKVVIEASESLMFEPNGFHIMLMGPKHPLHAGTEIPVMLTFADGEVMHVTFMVKGANEHTEHGHTDHGHTDHGTMNHDNMKH